MNYPITITPMTHDRTDNNFEPGLFGPSSAHETLTAIAAKYPESSTEHANIMLAIKGLFFICVNGHDAAFDQYVRNWGKKPLTEEQYKRLNDHRRRSLRAYERRWRLRGQQPPAV